MTYKTSKDYERLADLVESGEKIVGLHGDTYSYVHAVRKDGSEYESYYSGVDEFFRDTETRAEFIQDCVHHDVEFIDPASQERPKVWHSPEEVPELGQQILMMCKSIVNCDYMRYDWMRVSESKRDIWHIVANEEDIIKWAYVSDLEGVE